MVSLVRGNRLRRYLAGGCISLLGGLLLLVPLYDMWDDTSDLSWSLTSTVVENVVFILLSTVLVGGGVWLVRTDWETSRVATVTRRTLFSTAVVTVLIGWAVLLQLLVMEALKPTVLALNGVLVGSVVAFGLSVSTVRSDVFRQKATRNEAISDRLELLYRAASDLERAAERPQAYRIVQRAIEDVTGDAAFRIVVDGTEVVDVPETRDDSAASADTDIPGDTQPVEVFDIGGRGRIEFVDRSLESHERRTIELFSTYLEKTLQRIEREESVQDERDILEFVNRTLRHDMLGDLSLLQARLGMLDRNVTFEDDSHEEHLTVALDRVTEMEDFVRTMRTYMQSVLDEEHELEAVALAPLVGDIVETIRQTYPDATVEQGDLPEVAVVADELLDRVFVNLFVNAVEHNDADTPRVRIDGERRDDAVVVEVADNGPGISEDRRESIFERGERGTESDGSGFGLYLVKDVVENYGGTVRIRDNEPRGTVFELTLPIAGE